MPREGDAEALFADIREEDRLEAEAAAGPDVLTTIKRSIALSTDCVVAERGDTLLAIFGVAPMSLVSTEAALWMLGTNTLRRHRRTLVDATARYVELVLPIYPVLANWVDCRNTASIKLLRWLGFTFGEPEAFGAKGLPFMRFEMRRQEPPCALPEPAEQVERAQPRG